MPQDPYRTPAAPAADPAPATAGVETPLTPVLLVGLAAAASRVVEALAMHEEFTAEPTLALLGAATLALASSSRLLRRLRA